jgi:DEAD/DEAH box helicase domain-containing protein
MKQPLVLDIETQKTFNDVGRKNLHLLKVSVVGIYRYDLGKYEVYEESQLSELETLCQNSDPIIGYNIRRFDFPVLQPYFFMNVKDLPVLDLMEDVEKVLGFRIGLNNLAQNTLGEGKSGSGLDAVRFFAEGKMAELKKYCLDDVRLTKDLYEYGKEHGKIIANINHDTLRKEVPVPWKNRQTV